MSGKQIIDKVLGKFVSKKLTVFILACVFLTLDKIVADQWINVAMIYIGSQAAVDMIIKLRNKG